MRYGFANSRRDDMMHFGGLHSTEHLNECTMQAAQPGVEGSVALFFVMRRCVLTGMPDSMRNGDLLCEQQEQDASEMRESTLCHAAVWRYRIHRTLDANDIRMMPHRPRIRRTRHCAVIARRARNRERYSTGNPATFHSG
jgi:hypothetical protein